MQFHEGQPVTLNRHEVYPDMVGKPATVVYASSMGMSNEGNAIGEHYAVRVGGKTVGAWPDMLDSRKLRSVSDG